jgi:hypothetical protein
MTHNDIKKLDILDIRNDYIYQMIDHYLNYYTELDEKEVVPSLKLFTSSLISYYTLAIRYKLYDFGSASRKLEQRNSDKTKHFDTSTYSSDASSFASSFNSITGVHDYTSNDYTSNDYTSNNYTSNDYTSNNYTSNDYTSNDYISNISSSINSSELLDQLENEIKLIESDILQHLNKLDDELKENPLDVSFIDNVLNTNDEFLRGVEEMKNRKPQLSNQLIDSTDSSSDRTSNDRTSNEHSHSPNDIPNTSTVERNIERIDNILTKLNNIEIGTSQDSNTYTTHETLKKASKKTKLKKKHNLVESYGLSSTSGLIELSDDEYDNLVNDSDSDYEYLEDEHVGAGTHISSTSTYSETYGTITRNLVHNMNNPKIEAIFNELQRRIYKSSPFVKFVLMFIFMKIFSYIFF